MSFCSRNVLRCPSRNSGRSAAPFPTKVCSNNINGIGLRTWCADLAADSPYLNASYFNPQLFYQRSVGQLPVVTCFIPSLPAQSPLRFSVHSWEKPQPSRILESFMHPDDCVLYEVRIYTDNVYVAYVLFHCPLLLSDSCVASNRGSLFGPRTTWPQILDFNSRESGRLYVLP